MAVYYRLYFLGDDGHIVGHSAWDSEDDTEAMQCAEAVQEGRAMELWCGNRVVRRYPKPLDRR